MFDVELSAIQVFGIPLCTVMVWAAVKYIFKSRPFAMLPGPEGRTLILGGCGLTAGFA